MKALLKAFLKAGLLRAAGSLICSVMLCRSAPAAAPPNDNFVDAQLILFGNELVTGSNVGATKEAGEPDHAENAGGKSVWWKITPSEAGYLTLSTLKSVSTSGFPLDTLLAIYTGSDVSNLVLLGANDQDPETGEDGSTLLLRVGAGVEYHIAVDGYTWEDFGPDEGSIVLEVRFSKTIASKPAPPWELPDLNGKKVRSTDFQNKIVLLNFWATWCAPCVAETPDLIALQEKYRDRGLVIVGIAIDNAEAGQLPIARVGTFVQEHEINYPVVMTRPGGGTVEADYGLLFIPTSVFVDRKNKIVRRIIGMQTLEKFEEYLLPLLDDININPPDGGGGDPPDSAPPNLDNIHLLVSRAAGKIILQWPTLQAQVQLQYSDRLPAARWTPVTEIASASPDLSYISLDEGAPGTTRFYRLQILP